jgi:hypothetical protein
MTFTDAVRIAYGRCQALTVDAARETYIAHRKAEMLADPAEIVLLSRYLMIAHPTLFGNVLNDVMRERVGSLAAMLDMMEKGAEDLAQDEWASPVRDKA